MLRSIWYDTVVNAPTSSDEPKDSVCEELDWIVYHFPKQNMKIKLETVIQSGQRRYFETDNWELHDNIDDNGVKFVNLAA